MIISLIHPSRSRPQKSVDNLREWKAKAGVQVEVIVSCDKDDPQIYDYVKAYAPGKVLINQNKSVVDATNKAAAIATGDILIYLSDDFKCPEDWGRSIINEIWHYRKPILLKVDDCLQDFKVPVVTIPIMNRLLYKKLGYFWNPDYNEAPMFVDCDLYETCKRNGWIRPAPHLKFPHLHVSIGKAEMDETYRRSSSTWDAGKAIFKRRTQVGFPL